MKFRADEVRFVDEQESLAHHAASLDDSVPAGYIPIGSLSNDMSAGPSDFGTPIDDFGANVDFQ